jgi:hypothetical protein
VAEVAVGAHADDLAAAALELFQLLVEGDDLAGADEGEVQGIEEHGNVLAPVVGKLEIILEAVVRHDGGGLEIGRFGGNQGHGNEIEVHVVHCLSLLRVVFGQGTPRAPVGSGCFRTVLC